MTTPILTAARLSGKRLAATLVVAVSAAIATGVISAQALQTVAPDWAADPDRLAAVIVALVYLCITVVVFLGAGRRATHRRACLGLTLPRSRPLLFGLAVWAGAYALAAALYTATTPLGLSVSDAIHVLWAIGADNGRLRDGSAGLVTIILIRVCVLAPVAEELVFRGALFTWLRSRLSARWTIVLTGVGFALIHQVPAMLPLAVTVGLAAGVIRERTGSATIPIIVHAAQNTTIVALSYMATGWNVPSLFQA